MTLTITPANLDHHEDADAVLLLLQSYAADPLGGSIELSAEVVRQLIPGLRSVQGCLILLARINGQPAGLAIAFRGFSTWKAAPLINLHDLAVHPAFRGQGIGRKLLNAVEEYARSTGCCRLTLEVRVDNEPAKNLYLSEGFRPGDPPQQFWVKPLESTPAI